MQVLILSQYFYPEQDLKCLPLAREFKSKGFHVEVLTGYPSHPKGKLYKRYKKRLFQKELIEDVKVIRVPLYINHSSSAVKRILNYLSFAFAATFIGIFIIKRPTVIYTYHAPATIALPAIFFKLIYRSKIFYDINDFWPDTIAASGMLNNKMLLKLIGFYCKYSYYFFDHINVVSKGYKEKLLKLGVLENKISIIYNWALLINSTKSDIFQKYKEIFVNNFSIVYAGNIGNAQSLEVVINSVIKLKKEGFNSVKFFLIGNGIEKEYLESLIVKNNLQNDIILPGLIPSENIGEFLEASDVLFLHLKKHPLFEITIPSKLGNYFCMSKPILCGVHGEAAKMVEISKSGLYFEPDNYEDLYSNILTLTNLSKIDLFEMGNNGKMFYDNMISFEIGSNKIMDILIKLDSKH